MQIRIFTLSINASDEAQEEVNKFFRSHRILEFKSHYDDGRGLWTIMVTFLESDGLSNQKSERVDYRNILSADQFSVFCTLREKRKAIAKDENIPAYAVFTDKELAEIAKLDSITPSAIMKIKGISSGRMEKYGLKMLEHDGLT